MKRFDSVASPKSKSPYWHLTFEHKLYIGFTLVFLIVGSIFLLFIKNNKSFIRNNQWVDHTRQVLQETDRVNTLALKIQAASWAYVFTGKEEFSEELHTTAKELKQEIDLLDDLTHDNPSQQARIPFLRQLIQTRVHLANSIAHLRAKAGMNAAIQLMQNGKGIIITDDIQDLLKDIQDEENRLLKIRQKTNEATIDNTFILTGVFMTIVLLLLAIGFIVIITTFQARKKVEQRLSESSEWFSKTLSSIGDAVIATDENAIITFINPVAETLSGWPSAEAIGTSLDIVFDIVNEETRQAVQNPAKTVIREKRSVGLANHTLLIRKDRSEVAIDDSAAPVFGSHQELKGVVLVFRDVEKQREAEKLLKRSNERFLKIFNLSPVAISITEAETGRFINVNNAFCKLFDVDAESLMGKTSLETGFFHKTADRDAAIEKIREEIANPDGIELTMNSPGGETRDVLVYRESIDIEGKRCFVAAMVDIGERKKSEEKVRAANKELEAFSYSVSHDLRAPLRSIDGYTRILMEDYGQQIDAEGNRLMNIIIGNAKRMGSLIDDLLEFSRLGKQNLLRVPLNMEAIVRTVVEEQKLRHKDKAVEVEIRQVNNISGDSNMIRQVLVNLIDNAQKYSGKKAEPRIEIGSYRDNGTSVYYVKDNGAGFDMKYYDKLFGVFQRLHSAHEFEGTGVGLALVQRIVSKHGGRVWAEGAVDQGATFFFSIPDTQPTL